MAHIGYSDLVDAFDFVASAPQGTNAAYVALDTGEIYWHSDEIELDGSELPDDLDSDRYVEVPHKNELDLGKPLVLRFAAEALPDLLDRIEACFRNRGAYGRIKDLFASRGVLEKWHAFEQEAEDKALRRWCAEVELEIVESDPPSADTGAKTKGSTRA